MILSKTVLVTLSGINIKYYKNNGITLCQECHKQIHSIFGLKTIKNHLDLFISTNLSV